MKHCIGSHRRKFLLFLLIWLLCGIILFTIIFSVIEEDTSDTIMESLHNNNNNNNNNENNNNNNNNNNEVALHYISNKYRQIWQNNKKYILALGIPSLDLNSHHRRRALQRASWMQFPGVATKYNNFNGEIIVLFVLAKHFLYNFTYSPEILREVEATQDIITLKFREGRANTNKKIGSAGHWGIAAEIGTSRKSLAWYQLALHLFPLISFIGKCDDDVFINVPQLLIDLHQLPQEKLYWGRIMRWWPKKGNKKRVFYFVGGMCIIMARDIVMHITNYKPLQELLSYIPGVDVEEIVHDNNNNKSNNNNNNNNLDMLEKYKSLNTDHEDVMLGRILYETRHSNVIFVKEERCRFHDIHVGANKAPTNSKSVVIHHLKEHEYKQLAERFRSVSSEEIKPMKFERHLGPVGIVGEALYSYRC